ncbi:sensor histidine kinase [Halorientalis brevis]|uniref:sensor histidine kinase n=1 Tax=Halorientalis brevis TaxID=1126241 RepID=UPI001FFC0BFD
MAPRQRLTRELVAGVVSGVGAVASAVNLLHLFEETGVVAIVTGVLVPMGLSVTLVGSGYWLYTSAIETEFVPRVGVWFVSGVVGMAAIGAVLLVYQSAEDGVIRHGWFVLGNLLTTGGIGGFVVGVYDARQRQHQRDLSDSRARYRTLTDVAPDAMVVADSETGEIIDANAEAETLFGRSRDELVGMHQTALHPTDRTDAYRELFERHVDAEKQVMTALPDGSDIHVVTGDGETVPVEINAAVFEQRDRSLVLGMFRDVSRRKAREREMERTTEELEILNRVVRHDIRNDMEVVSSWLDLLDDHVDPEGEEIIDRVTNATAHTIELTDVARDYVKVITGQETQDHTRVSLARVLTEEVETRRTTYPDAEFTIEDPLPSVEVVANEMLSSVFRNLLNNAVQHNDKATPRVWVSVETSPETVTVRIADNGPGVPDDRKDDVFGKGAKGLESPGTGIGLYLVQQLVAEYGGDVWVTDRDPQGATASQPVADAGTTTAAGSDAQAEHAADADGAVFVVELQRADS